MRGKNSKMLKECRRDIMEVLKKYPSVSIDVLDFGQSVALIKCDKGGQTITLDLYIKENNNEHSK